MISDGVRGWILIAAFLAGLTAQGLLLSGSLSAGLLLYAAAGAVWLAAIHRPSCLAPQRTIDSPWQPSAPFSWPVFAIAASIALSACGFIFIAARPGSEAPWGFDAAFWLWALFITTLVWAARHELGELAAWLKRIHWAPPAALSVIALVLGFYRLTEIPVTVHGDEGMVGLHARIILNGEAETLFSSSWYVIPQLFYAIPAAGMALLGDDLFGLRGAAVLLGWASVMLVYFSARHCWGTHAAIFAALMMCVNHWFLFLQRSGVHYGQAAFFLIGTFALWLWLRRKPSLPLAALAGAWMGLALQSYQANHILPLLWVVSQLYLWALRRIPLRWLAWSTALPVATAALTIAPLIVHDLAAVSRVDAFSARANSVGIWNDANWAHLEAEYNAEDNPNRVWRTQLTRAFLAPVATLDRSAQFGGLAPMLDPAAAVLFVFAALTALSRWYDPRWAIPLIWASAILSAGAALLIDNPFYPRLAGAAPLLFIMIAGAAPFRFANAEGAWKQPAVWLTAILLILCVRANINEFFVRYASQVSPQSIHYPQTRLAKWIAEQPQEAFIYVLPGPHCSFGSGTVRFIAKHARGANVESPQAIDPGRTWAVALDPSRKQQLPDVLERIPNGEVELHRNPFGDLLFYSVTPKGQ